MIRVTGSVFHSNRLDSVEKTNMVLFLFLSESCADRHLLFVSFNSDI